MPDNISLIESLSVSLLGFSIVFVILVVLIIVLRLLRFFISKYEKAPVAPTVKTATAAKPAVKALAAGDADIFNADDKTAAALMAIIAEESKIPLDKLRIISVKEININNKNANLEQKNKYTVEPGEELSGIMK